METKERKLRGGCSVCKAPAECPIHSKICVDSPERTPEAIKAYDEAMARSIKKKPNQSNGIISSTFHYN